MSDDELKESVREWAATFGAVATYVEVWFVAGKAVESVRLLVPPPARGKRGPQGKADIRVDIADVIEAAGKRLSGDRIRLALGKAEKEWSDSYVGEHLADMVKRGQLSHTSKADAHGVGYGLPFWGTSEPANSTEK